jgi:adenosylhomocysteine nucleosidase
MAILYVAAEAAELKPMAALLTGLRKLNWPLAYAHEGLWEGRRLLLAANGAGPALAARAVETAIRAITAADLSSSSLEAVVSTGLCGGLDPTLRRSDVVVATEVLALKSGESYPCAAVESGRPAFSGTVVSDDRIVGSAAEKSRLRASSGAVAVEMEAAGVAARVKRAGLPFCCIKVVSDSAEESFALDLNQMRTGEGRIARGKIVFHALKRPNLLPGLFQLKRRSDEAARVLGEFLVSCRITANADSARSA